MPLPDGIKLRAGRRGDRASLYKLLEEVGVNVGLTDQENAVRWIVSHPESEVWIAVDPLDRGVGFVSLSHRPQLRVAGRIATIEDLVVTKAMRRRGIGEELIQKALERARSLGCKRVVVTARGPDSDAWLRKHGFGDGGATLLQWDNPTAG